MDLIIKKKQKKLSTNLAKKRYHFICKSDTINHFLSFSLRIFFNYRNEFLAVRNQENSFYLCICTASIKKSSKSIQISWLNKVESSDDDIYGTSYHDKTHILCVLTTVKLDKVGDNYQLMHRERERIENVLKDSLDAEKALASLQEVVKENMAKVRKDVDSVEVRFSNC